MLNLNKTFTDIKNTNNWCEGLFYALLSNEGTKNIISSILSSHGVKSKYN